MIHAIPFLAGWEFDERNGVILTVDGQPAMRPVFQIVELSESEFKAFEAGRDLLETNDQGQVGLGPLPV